MLLTHDRLPITVLRDEKEGLHSYWILPISGDSDWGLFVSLTDLQSPH